MKAKIDINEAIIKQALTLLFEKLNPGEITLRASPRFTPMDQPTGGHNISGTIEVELGEVIAH